jgi:hypothetical protein
VSDLLVEFYEDYYTDHPDEARRVVSKGGDFVFTDTGDPLLDKWETEFAKGVIPDLEEGLSSQEKERLRKERQKAKRARTQASALEFEEDYTKPPADQKMQSKFARPGSPEEGELLSKKALGNDKPAGDWHDLLMGSDG